MVRKPTPKRRAPTPPREEAMHALSFKLPSGLVAEIDAIAATEERSRAKMIEIGMRQFVQSYQRRDAA
jgi:predicted transcriptional regulator